MTDMRIIEHPEHYTDGEIECIDAIESALTYEELRGYLKGNVIKYMWRERLKGGTTDVMKANWYAKKLIEVDER